MVRPDNGGYEPWTWVRKQGKGRVYYTASGHDERTWNNPGYHRLLTAGIRWAAGVATDDSPALSYESAGVGLPNYKPRLPGGKREGSRIMEMQKPLSPEDSLKHMHLPEGFHVELFAAEPDIVKPIAMGFDYRGRLWVSESTDYPHKIEQNPEREGGDKIVICEDTKGTGRADKFTVFADHVNMPMSLVSSSGGMIASLPPHAVLLKDSHGGDHCDTRQILLSGFGRGDTHATASNFHYGLDNWIYGTIGYDGGTVTAGGVESHFRQCFYRFRPDGSAFEVLTQTSNNTWGLGLSPAGDVFGSTANNEHAVHLAIPNRFFEMVRGWSGHGSEGIADHKQAHPITDDVRQVDWFGGYTAAAGFELYTARSFPKEYWDRAAFVCEPTEHLIHIDWLVQQGSAFVARDGFNLMASTDGWTAPIAATVGPDGAVWVLDWYSPVVQAQSHARKVFQDRPGRALPNAAGATRRTGGFIALSPTAPSRRHIPSLIQTTQPRSSRPWATTICSGGCKPSGCWSSAGRRMCSTNWRRSSPQIRKEALRRTRFTQCSDWAHFRPKMQRQNGCQPWYTHLKLHRSLPRRVQPFACEKLPRR